MPRADPATNDSANTATSGVCTVASAAMVAATPDQRDHRAGAQRPRCQQRRVHEPARDLARAADPEDDRGLGGRQALLDQHRDQVDDAGEHRETGQREPGRHEQEVPERYASGDTPTGSS